MGSPLAGDPSIWPPEILICDDADPPNGATFGVGQEGLTHRTAYDHARIGDIVERTTPIADLTALAAILAPAHGTLRFVHRHGWYAFDSASVDAEFKPHTVAAADATPGKWVAGPFTPRFRERGVTLSNFLVANNPLDSLGLIARDKTAVFHSGSWTHLWSGGGLVSRRWAELWNGGLIMHEAPSNAVDGTYGVLWCLDEVLGESDSQLSGRGLSKLLAVSVRWIPNTGRSALPTYKKASVGCFRAPRMPGNSGAPVLESLWSGGDFREDDAADVTEYETPHVVSHLLDIRNDIDLASYSYYLQFWNEQGDNSLSDNRVGSVTASVQHYYATSGGGAG